MKIAAVVIGLFVAGLAYLSYRGWVDVKWAAMEDASRGTLANASEQIAHALNTTATQFASHPPPVAVSVRIGLRDFLEPRSHLLIRLACELRVYGNRGLQPLPPSLRRIFSLIAWRVLMKAVVLSPPPQACERGFDRIPSEGR